jgi:hypothetical protein
MVVAPIRLAMNRWRSGLIVRSSIDTVTIGIDWPVVARRTINQIASDLEKYRQQRAAIIPRPRQRLTRA